MQEGGTAAIKRARGQSDESDEVSGWGLEHDPPRQYLSTPTFMAIIIRKTIIIITVKRIIIIVIMITVRMIIIIIMIMIM